MGKDFNVVSYDGAESRSVSAASEFLILCQHGMFSDQPLVVQVANLGVSQKGEELQ